MRRIRAHRISEYLTKGASKISSGFSKAFMIFTFAMFLVSCTSGNGEPVFSIGGTVSGLEGSGFVLLNNGGDDMSIASNGTFSFSQKMTNGKDYSVTIGTYPNNPLQTCTVTNGSGTISGASVTNVEIACTSIYTVGGTVSGLNGSGLVLQKNGGDNLSISANGAFAFETKLYDASAYNITVLTHPSGQVCALTGASGTISGTNVTNVDVQCHANSYSVGGTVSGLTGSGLILKNSGGDNLSVSTNSIFTFASKVADGNSYAVTVGTQPSGQTCVVTDNASGTISGADVTNVAVRCGIPGSLDATFGTGGFVTTSLGTTNDFIYDIALQTDGKIVAAGHAGTGANTDFVVARYNTDGSLDTTFGTSGIVIKSIATSDMANGVAIQSDDKIVAAGYSYNGSNNYFAIIRYNTNGSLDSGFGTGGIVTNIVGTGYSKISSVAIQSDGKIVAAGCGIVSSQIVFAVARYNTDGTLDTSFGTDGVVTTSFGSGSNFANGVAIQTDGKIVATGYTVNSSSYMDFAVARYNTNGTLDTTFGTGGKVTTSTGSANDIPRRVIIQTDGKIIVTGYASNGSGDDFTTVRYNANGSLDSSFGTGGIVITPITTNNDRAFGVAIQADGRIVVGGYAYTNVANSYIAMARYHTGGSLDSTFGTGGIVTTTVGPRIDNVYSVAIQTDGRIVAAGTSYNGSNYDFLVLRYWP